MKKNFKRVLAVGLSAVIAASAFSISAAAAYNPNYQSETHTVFRHTEQTLAPGVDYYNNYAYSSDGKQMVYYVATADISRDDVVVQTSYLNQYKDKQPGMSKLSEQAAFANQYYTDQSNPLYLGDNYNVVAGTNASFYNMQTGQPTGVCYVDGVSFGNTSYPAFFAILKDPDTGAQTAIMDDTANVGNYDNIWQAVGGQYWLVRDGADVTVDASGSYLTDRHSRTVVGITDDGKVVLMVLDGRQEPFSCGGNMHELAQIMIEAGCKYAMNIDGGGSTTFGARPEGEDDFRIINRPSDGSERSISSGLIIGSMATPSTDFDHVTMTAADEYVTPGTETDIEITGVSASGSSADIPAEITYEATNGTFADGKFTAGNAAGDAVVTAKYQGNVVGTATVHVVVPDSIAFSSENFTIPYGKSAELTVIAKKGLNEVKTKASDFTFTIAEPAAGTLDGFVFTAAGESEIASTTVTVALNGTELTASAGLVFGKGSEVIFDFEDGTTQGFGLNYSGYNYYLPNSKVFVADKENGHVHSGDYSLGLNIDYSNSQESGYQMIALYQGKVSGNVNYYPGALKLGTWLYIPDEYVGLWVRWTISPISAINENAETGETTYTTGSITPQTMDRTAGGTGVVYSFDEPGWHYLWADLSEYKGLAWKDFYYCMQFYISDRDGASYGYYAKDNHNINGDFTVYMDDVTVDYSTVVEDRDAPVFSSVLLGDRGPHSNDALVLTDGYDSDGYNQLSFSARVADFDSTNATGIDPASCKAYVDGNDIGCTYNGAGLISAGEEVKLHEGKHTVKFVACDNAGNRASITRTFTVSNVSNKEFIKVVPHDASLDRIPHGSLYWVDVVTTDAANTSKVVTTLNLDSMSKWELDHMTVADGFEASYEVVDAGDKIVKLTIEAVGEVDQTGELALVSIPIRTWYLDNSNKRNALSDKEWTYAQFKASKEFWPVATEVRVQQGLAYYKGSHRYFTGEDVFVWSESWANYANMTKTQEGKDYFNAWNGGHIHNAHEVADIAPTCTETGLTGKTFCDDCNSVVNWGTVVPATGHTYEFIDGVLKCKDCEELFNGEYTDGKFYVDGVPAQGEVEDKYYVDGVPFTGFMEVDGKYHKFTDGIDEGIYTGIVEEDGKLYYSKLGTLASGWFYIDDEWRYFVPDTFEAANGNVTTEDGVEFEFVDGFAQHPVWVDVNGHKRCWYGPDYYHNTSLNVVYLIEEIEGDTYLFDSLGYMQTGIIATHASNEFTLLVYDCGTDGKAQPYTGVYNDRFVQDGVQVKAYQLVEFNGDYYFITDGHMIAKNTTVYLGASAQKVGLEPGNYEFDAEGKMVIRNGVIGDYLYINNVRQEAYQLVQYEGDYYFVSDGHKVAKNTTVYLGASAENAGLQPGSYDFDADGKMVIRNGVVGDYLYINNVRQEAYQLVEYEGDYYFVSDGHKLARNTTIYLGNSAINAGFEPGNYQFGDDCKMIILNGVVGDYLYINNVRQEAYQLVEYEGDYYFVSDGHKVAKNTTIYLGNSTVGKLRPDGQPMEKGYYYFDADGKLVWD